MVKIGYPIPKNPDKGSLLDLITSHNNAGTSAFQICVTPTHNGYAGKPFDEKESKAIIELRKNKGIYICVHGKYIYNFSRKECSYQIDQLVHELQLSSQLGADVILHQGKNVKEERLTRLEALNNYVKHISEALEKTFELNNGILLENSAAQGTELGYGLDELVYIYNQFDDSLKPRVGFCIDLCHIFVAGELDVRKADSVELFFAKFASSIGLDKMKCIHYNDSSVPFGGCHDNHGDIQCGYISNPLLGGSVDGFRVIARIAEKNNIAIIFETPCGFEQVHMGISQRFWQTKMVKGWAKNDDTTYLLYVASHPFLSQLAFDYYDKSKKKSIKKKIPKKTEECCSCIEDKSVPTSAPVLGSVPKIKIKLKSEQKS